METETNKDHKGAAEKKARRSGQHNKTSADMTPEILSSLYNALVKSHMTPSSSAGPSSTGVQQAASAGAAVQPPSPVAPAPPPKQSSTARRDVAASNLSSRQTYFLAYVFYAFLFKTLARPWMLVNLKYNDVTLPDLFVAENRQFQNLHRHPRFLNVTLRVTKTGTSTTQMFIVRIYSYNPYVSPEEEAKLGSQTVIQCDTPEANLPQLFKGVLCMAAAAPVVDNNGAVLAQLPVFPHMSTGGGRNTVLFLRPRTNINERLTRDLQRIGMDMNNGERASRMYGFRRGGAQELLGRTGKYEFVMRLGDWNVESTSFFTYITYMNARGTLRATLRSFGQDDVSQTVAQVLATHSKWAADVVPSLRARVMGQQPPLDNAGVSAFDKEAAARLSSMFVETVLQLRHGRKDAEVDVQGDR